MKQFLTIIFLVSLLSVDVFGQSPCATEYPQEMETWLRNYKANNPGSHHNKSAATTLYVPIVAHIVGTDAGTGYYRTDYLMDAMCNINIQYADVDIFYYLDDVNYIKSTELYDHSGNYNSVFQLTRRPNVVNMYFVQDPNGACGYFSGWQDIIAINKSCGAIDNSTIAHELGHYMSLPHTFYGWEGRSETANARFSDERVDGSNCGSAGDFFCDTPADYLSDRWNCPYNKTKLDYNGDQYQVDGELYMSYANDACQSYFSNEQIDAMRAYLQNNSRRSGHLGYTPTNFDPSPKTTLLFPLDSMNYSPPSNYVELKWNAVEGAEFYSVMLTQGSNPNFFLFDTITKDTTVLLKNSNIQPNFTYRWRVAAFHEGNTCGEYTDFEMFSASSPVNFEPIVNISPETCKRFDGAVQVAVSGSGAPFTYEWSNGVLGDDVSGLESGNYLLTVSSSNNQEIVLSVDVPYSGSVDVDFSPFGAGFTSIKANPYGGVAPYTYLWSDNTSDQEVQLNEPGEYSVTVTDINGCSITKSYTFTDINEAIDENSLSIFPNPLSSGNTLNLKFNANEIQNYQLQLIDVSGKVINQENIAVNNGSNLFQLSTNGLSNGVYILRISNKDISINKKVYVY